LLLALLRRASPHSRGILSHRVGGWRGKYDWEPAGRPKLRCVSGRRVRQHSRPPSLASSIVGAFVSSNRLSNQRTLTRRARAAREPPGWAKR